MRAYMKKAYLLLPAVLLIFSVSLSTFAKADSVFMITSPAITPGKTIPAVFTCKGRNISPPLSWSDPPAETKSLVLVVDDPDAPSGTFTHWIAWNLPPKAGSLPEGASGNAGMIKMVEGINDFYRTGYGGPCPPPGLPHHYRFTLYALDTRINLSPRATRRRLDEAISGHVIKSAGFSAQFAITGP